jgi:hypothetical protein
MHAVDLLPKELRESLPPLNAQEGTRDPVVYAKFHTRDSGWIWYVTEGSSEEDDFVFFGFVSGEEKEWGEFSLSELKELGDPSESLVERDLNFKPGPLSEVLAKENR